MFKRSIVSNFFFGLLIISTVLTNASIERKSRGMVLCGGDHMMKDIIAIIDQTRIIWKSNLPVTVAHCGEIYDNNVNYLQTINATVLNICQNSTGDTVFGMNADEASKRLKSWFCKTAALILSPYDETMVVDLDVIFFKNPEVLFDSPAYKQTGSLFFRDKLTHSNKKKYIEERVYQDLLEDFVVLEGGFNMTTDLGKDQFGANGISFFWMNLADREKGTYNNFQDSSLILLDRSTHPETLKVMLYVCRCQCIFIRIFVCTYVCIIEVPRMASDYIKCMAMFFVQMHLNDKACK